MRRLLALILLLNACGGGSSVPTPEQILDDGIVSDAEFRTALGAVEECVHDAGAEFSVVFDQSDIPRYRVELLRPTAHRHRRLS
jgi:hypothetical protein